MTGKNGPFLAACLSITILIGAAIFWGEIRGEERQSRRDVGWRALEDGQTQVQEITTASGMECLLVKHHLVVGVSCQ